MLPTTLFFFFFFFNDTATTEIYTLSLHDALPICPRRPCVGAAAARGGLRPADQPAGGGHERARRGVLVPGGRALAPAHRPRSVAPAARPARGRGRGRGRGPRWGPSGRPPRRGNRWPAPHRAPSL